MNKTPTDAPARVRRMRLGAAAIAVGAVLMGMVLASPARAKDASEHKVTLCHATSSATNPYVLITVDYHSITQAGHSGHADDIIPPFDLGDDAQFAGMNWDANGQTTLANGCVVATTTTTGGA